VRGTGANARCRPTASSGEQGAVVGTTIYFHLGDRKIGRLCSRVPDAPRWTMAERMAAIIYKVSFKMKKQPQVRAGHVGKRFYDPSGSFDSVASVEAPCVRGVQTEHSGIRKFLVVGFEFVEINATDRLAGSITLTGN